LFSWQDLLGQHNGSRSYYLWKYDPPTASYFIAGSGELKLENKTIIWSGSSIPSQTVFLKNYFQPKIPELQKILKYVPNTSIQLEAYDLLGKTITSFSDPVKIKISFSDSDLAGISKESVKIYFWDLISKLWTPLPTILDLIFNTATAETHHLSNFVLLGEKMNTAPPLTLLNVSGAKTSNWFTEFPVLELTVNGPDSSQATIFFTTGGETEWEEYLNPVTLRLDGIINLQYRSQDVYGNLEETQNYVLQIDTKDKGKKTVKIKNNTFETTE
jgi:hypothetical protein